VEIFSFIRYHMYTPFVIEKSATGERSYDIWSRLLKDRIIFLGTEVNDFVANSLIAQLLFLEQDDKNLPIEFYIYWTGGSVSAGLAIYDTMNYIRCDVSTLCMGQAASMGSFLLMAGTSGKRFILPHSRVMVHQPSGGARGQATDIEIQAKEILYLKALINEIYSKHTGQPVEKIKDALERDNFMNAQQAKDFGLVDEIISQRS
jgi:ATP-dependent Clp protease protease subunit